VGFPELPLAWKTSKQQQRKRKKRVSPANAALHSRPQRMTLRESRRC